MLKKTPGGLLATLLTTPSGKKRDKLRNEFKQSTVEYFEKHCPGCKVTWEDKDNKKGDK